MQSIQEIFENSLFRIPDYQRGFSWKETHLDDFWQDLMNLRDDRYHFTGALTLEKPTSDDLKKWKGDDWIISTGNYKPYYVVDGQQRITTIIILLNLLIEQMDEEDQYLYQGKEDLIAKYKYKKNEKNKLQSYIFGYEVDDPSYEFLKTRIFKQESSESDMQPETTYTNNLFAADKFFRERTEKLSFKQKEQLFKKVTQQLKFDLKIIESDLDIFVVFETMNNRGKPLTNLEKLKNRLIYLTTLMADVNDSEMRQLRKEINDVWKTCYEYLGKNKKNPLNDDAFLRNHFIMYHIFEKTKDYPYLQIFKQIYTVQNTVSKKPTIEFKIVRKYISSLQKASKLWYIINNPIQAYNNELISEEETYWLEKLHRLGLRVFGPLTLTIFMLTNDINDRLEYLKGVESFIFLNYLCAGRRSTLGNSDFPYIANHLYNKKSNWTIQLVIEELGRWTFGDENGDDATYSNERFILNLKDQAINSKKNGYYDWPGIRYLLYEYEEYLQRKEPSKVKWATPNSIEHIYPQSEADPEWKSKFKEFTPRQKKIICNSLGNLVLLRSSKNSQLSNRSFSYKKNHTNEEGEISGYINGSHSEIEVSQFKDWNARSIYKRGMNILNFIQIRWGILLSTKEKSELLFADETLIKKIKSL